MNWMTMGGLGALTVGLFYMFVEQKPADIYDMPVLQAYALLSNAKFEPMTQSGVAADLQRSASGNGRDTIYWSLTGSHVARKCEISLVPADGDEARTHVSVNCRGGAPSDGAAQGITHNYHRNAVIERIDATLTGRPFDASRAAETAFLWPDDGVEGGYVSAAKKAVEMDREMRQMGSESAERKDARLRKAQLDNFYASVDEEPSFGD